MAAAERVAATVALGAFEPSGVRVPCRQCGRLTEPDQSVIALATRFNAQLVARGEAELAPDELVTCGDEDCQRAEREALRERAEREQRELDAIVRRIRNYEPVTIPPGFARTRPSDMAVIEREVEAARKRRAEEQGE